ncbi:MAG TPA: tripartite tricarboxylate transporter substrate binding protein [Hyphomicrobiaceae bacterium]|nr:tripartite tricarboxylate transporter substrate binding protein [Hyphomicrobiaceae bacterium]
MRALPTFARVAALAVAGLVAAGAAAAETYPDRPVRVIAGYPAGGGGDTLVRYYAAQLEKATGQKFVVENKVGANGKIATDTALRAKPDGYTLLIHGTAAVVGNTVLMKNPGYDAMDLQPVATLAQSVFVITVGPKSKVTSLKELVADLKTAGGKLKYGTATPVGLVASEKFLLATGTKAERVNYKGTMDAAREMVTSQIDFLFADATFAIAQAKQGRMKLLGMTSKERLPSAPDVPTMTEAGVPYEFTPKWAAWMPKGTPKEMVEKMGGWLRDVAKTDATKAFLLSAAATPLLTNSTAEATEIVKSDLGLWKRTTQEAKIEPQG